MQTLSIWLSAEGFSVRILITQLDTIMVKKKSFLLICLKFDPGCSLQESKEETQL